MANYQGQTHWRAARSRAQLRRRGAWTDSHVRGGSSTLLSADLELPLFDEGLHSSLYRSLGAHPYPGGTRFQVWAPGASAVQVLGDFDAWGEGRHQLRPSGRGTWSGTIAGARVGQRYRYRLTDGSGQRLPDKADPFAAASEAPPGTWSAIADLRYDWQDDEWMATRGARQGLASPVSIYELHIGSWRAGLRERLGYRALADPLADHVLGLGFTHVELMPVLEHPYYGSWGYQPTGYFAPTSRYGSPQDLMHLVDTLHRRGLGVILDWTPAHFADDAHGLANFDGTSLFEHAEPRRARHPQWGSLTFNYDRPEVRSFLISSACSWLERYHLDGLRVDAVTSMLNRDFGREPGGWEPNAHGGNEDYGAVRLLRDLNQVVHARFPGVQTYAEERASWPGVTHPTAEGGLGFDFKWDVGWTNDTLRYLARDPAERAPHHRDLTFRSLYASTERFLLPLSHDEVGNGQGSLLQQLAGSPEERHASLRALLGYQFATPGRKLVFMGTELATETGWDHEQPLDWAGAQADAHDSTTARWLTALNRLYAGTPALHEDLSSEGFEWLVADDPQHPAFAFLRWANDEPVLVVANFGAAALENCTIGVPRLGSWRVLLDSDASEFGGSGTGPRSSLEARATPLQGQPCSLSLPLPPLSLLFLAPERGNSG